MDQAEGHSTNVAAEQRLLEREQHFRVALEAGRMGSWEWILSTNEVRWSEALENIHGLEPGTFGCTFEAFRADIHPEDISKVEEAIARTLRDSEHHIEYRIIRPDGQLRWVEGRGKLFKDADGNPSRVMGVCVDVTERKESESRLAKRAHVQSVLYDLTDRLHRAKTLREVYDIALDCIIRAVDCDRASLLLYDDAGIMRFVAWRGLSDHYRGQAEGHSPWSRGDVDAKPICVNSIEAEPFEPPLQELIHGEGIRSLCFIPLIGDDELIGKFMVYFDRPHEFNDEEVDLVLIISRQLATGIEYKQAEAALRDREQSLRLALDAGRMGTWEWIVGSDTVKWSSGLERLYGFAPGEFPATIDAYRQRIHPEDRIAQAEAFQKNLESSDEHDVEHRVLWPDGSIRWVEGRGTVFRDETGKPIRMVGVSADITDRKRSEYDMRFLADASATLSELVSVEETLQRLADLAVPHFADWCGIDLLTNDNQLSRIAVAHVDPNRVRLARELQEKYPPDPNSEQGVWKVLKTGEAELVSHISDEMIAMSTADPELLRIIRELGLRSYISVPLTVRGRVLGAISFVAAESGREYGERELALAEDLANRAAVAMENSRLYQELRDADRRKDTFLATLAHELRNPLAPMQHAVELMSMSEVDPRTREDARATIERQLAHMVRLVDDLLDISRISQDKLKLQRSQVDLASIVAQAREAAWPAMQAQKQDLRVDIPDRTILIDGDRTRLVQVISNLLSNASKFSDPGSRIDLKADVSGDHLVLEVSDQGIGIGKEQLERVFDMFSQADHIDLRRQTGLGIGLSLAKRLVELHGGSITAYSPGLGEGSTFEVQLPIIPEPSSNKIQGEQEPSSNQLLRVLVVDDNADAARMLGFMLKTWGHQTETAGDGQAAVDLVETFQPDLVLMDLGLPIIDGYEAARRIRQIANASEVKLIAISGWGQSEDRARSAEAGFDAHLVKPVSSEELKSAIDSLM